MLVLAVLWWAWAGYAWLTNALDPEEGRARLAMFAAMGAMLIAALAVPHAFGDDALLVRARLPGGAGRPPRRSTPTAVDDADVADAIRCARARTAIGRAGC